MIQCNVSLKPHNTFQVDAKAEYWSEIHQPEDLLRLMDTEIYQTCPSYILGGGSNILITGHFDGLIIKNEISGITILSEEARHIVLKAGAGVIWDDLVSFALKHNLGGIENLSMIPGSAGAAPIQNIGAYGVEFESVFLSLDAIDLNNGKITTFDKQSCRFGYRDSIFKHSEKKRFLITHIVIRLSRIPSLTLDYGNLKEVLKNDGIPNPTLHDVSRAVRKIRASKLPDPSLIGNAGSFFKNPVVDHKTFSRLKTAYPSLPGYSSEAPKKEQVGLSGDTRKPSVAIPDEPSEKWFKIPAAWLIEQCGFKGKRNGDAGVHNKHALILVNHGKATGREILALAINIREEVNNTFGISLEPEVNIVGPSEPALPRLP